MTSIVTGQIAKHMRELHTGGNWTCSNVKEVIAGVTWEESLKKVQTFNTIATLVFHTNYYVSAMIRVLQGGKLDADDKYSFAHPPLSSQNDWDKMLEKFFNEAELLASLIEKLPDSQLWENVEQEKYGTFYRNLHGIIEHSHYHLGQIALIKKMIRSNQHASTF